MDGLNSSESCETGGTARILWELMLWQVMHLQWESASTFHLPNSAMGALRKERLETMTSN